MPSTVVDLVKINVISTGAGSFTLGTTATGYRGVEALSDNTEYGYSVQSGSAWEVGRGTYFLSTQTLTRSVIYSSNGGEAVPFGANVQVAFVALAEDLDAINLSAAAVAAAATATTAAASSSASASAASASAATAEATVAGLGAVGGAALVGAQDSSSGSLFTTVQGAINATIPHVTIAALRTLAPATFTRAYVTDSRKEGVFEWVTGTYTTQVAADTLSGIYVASSVSGYGTTVGCWVRVWDWVNGYPEWFGAVSGGADCYAAITACMSLCPITNLGEADYYISATLRIPPYRHLKGVGSPYRAGSGNGTRLVVQSATADVLAMGLASYPSGGVNNFAKGSSASGFSVGRNTAVTPPASGSNSSGACGLRMTFALHCRVDDVYADDHTIGFYFNGVVRTIIDDCKAFRQTSGTTSTNDFFTGFWADGSGSYGLSGGNGSLFIQDCGVSLGGSPALTNSTGYYLSNAFADTFLYSPEATGMATAIVLDGQSVSSSSAFLDVAIRNPILDATTSGGITVQNVNAYAAIEISGGYTALTGSVAFSGIFLNGATYCSGVTVFGHQIIGKDALASGSNCFGVYGTSANRFELVDVKAVGCGRPFGFVSCADFSADVIANNPGQTSTQAAVSLTSCAVATVKAKVTGQSGAFPQGLACVGSGNTSVEMNATRVNTTCLTGGAANKILINSVSITTPGYYTSAGASGASGANINVTGITV